MDDSKEPDVRMPLDDPTSPDAEWKKIQKNTFTRWCNEHLKSVNLFIYDLETDLCDGLKLIALLQNLAHKKIGRYNKKPSFPPQKRENVAIALKFIENEKIKLVNIDAGDIVKGNLKLILGLIWTLILKYQISMPMMDDEDEAAGLTPKQALMGWVKSKLPPEVKCNNFNTDWNDGVALASLVDASAPGLFPEWEDLDPKNKLENATEAMKRAEDWLGVPQVITPEEITNPNVDELSVMTYVSYFPEAKLKPGAPIKQKMSDASKCHAYGPGIEPSGVVANTNADFTIEATGSSKGKINVLIFGPGKQQIDCAIQDNHDNTFSCRYVPPKPGTYDVHIRVGSHHIPKSPFRVKVSSDTDVSKVYARGPGLEPTGVIISRPAKFEIVATDAGSGDVHIDVIDPKGGKKTEVHYEEKANHIYSCQYLPTMVGKYVICIKYGGTEIKGSPFRVNVDHSASKVKIFGPGLEPGLKTGKPAVFTVDCTAVGPGNLDVQVEGPSKGDVACNVEDNGDGTYTCTYKPTRPGTYIVKVRFDGIDVPKSPCKVTISSSADLSKIRAWGPGLEKGVAGVPAEFYVEAKAVKLDSLSFAVEGPSKARVEVTDSGEYQVTVRYFPEEPGEYTVHILCEEVDIPHSPFKVKVSPAGDPSKVYAEGPGLKPGCMVGRPAEFKIFTHKAGGEGIVDVTCTDEDGNPAEVKLKDNRDNTYSVSYMPLKPGKYTVTIKFNNSDIQKSPFIVPIDPYCDPSKVKADGPGLKGGKANKPAKFDIDASKAGDGGIGLTIEGPKEAKIDCDDHGDGTCSVEYFPEEDGEYTINILFADQHIPGSPFKAVISSDFDASKVVVFGAGLEPGCKAGRPCPITVDTRKAGKAKMVVEVEDEVGEPVQVDESEEEPGVYKVAYYPTKPGKHTVKVTFGGKPVPKSPFKVKIEPGADASKVKVSGPGIEPKGVVAGKPTYFIVDASEAGDGEVDVGIEPEGKAMPKVKDINVEKGDKPNTYRVNYVPPKEGKYTIPVKFAGEPVPKSPFKIDVKPGSDASKCKAYGPGLEEPIIGEENPFTVECPPEAGEGPLTVDVENPDGSHTDVKIKEKPNGKHEVSWTPTSEGKHKVTIKFGGDDIPKSPFKVGALPKGDASKVKAEGPGLDKAIVNRPNQFTINTKKAGAGNLGLAIEGPAEAKIKCTDNNDGTCTVEYVPVEEGDYDVNIKFADEHIPGSPFVVPAIMPVDASKVKCKGPGIGKTVTASFPQEFTVDAKQAGTAPLEVDVTGPDRKKRKPDIKDNKDGTFAVTYVPDLEGRYTVGVKYGGDSVPQSPFRVDAKPTGDASKCKVNGAGVERPSVGKPAPFEVDAKKAGKGKVNPTVKNPQGEEVPCTCEEVEDGVFACSWTPEEAGPHDVDVNFGGKPVKGSPFKPVATEGPDTSPIDTKELEDLLADEPVIDIPVESCMDCSEMPEGKLEGTIETPSGKKEKVPVTDNGDGSYNIDYTPKELGLYTLDITYDTAPVPGSPFKFKVVEPSPKKVKVHGPGIKKGVVGRPNAFIIDTKSAGPGKLSLAVEGPSKADVECVDNGDGTCTATYIPTQPGKYDIIVQFANKNVPGSPFKVPVVEQEPILEVGKPADVNMAPEDVRPSEIPTVKGVLAAPSGKESPVTLKEGPNKTLTANFTPEEAGPNKLGLKKRGKDIKDSPVPLLVRDKPVVGQPCEVPMELPDVKRPKDIKRLKGSLTRPNGKEEPVKIKVYPDDTISATFVPREPGKHLLNIKKNNKHVEDSPYVIMVEEPASGLPTVGNPCDVNLDIPDLKMPDDLPKVQATLKRPSGKEEPIDVKLGPEDTVAVSFVPTEPGEHLLSVKKDRKHVPNSPFSIIVEAAKEAPTEPTVGHECDVNLEIPNLKLPDDLKVIKAELERPNGKRKPLDVGVGPGDTISVAFTPTEPGKHLLHVKKRGTPVKGSPFPIMVAEDKPGKKKPVPVDDEEIIPMEEEREVESAPPMEEEEPTQPTVGNPCNVSLEIPNIKLPDDLKLLKGTLTRPNKKSEPIDITEGPDNTVSMNFTPYEPGLHVIDVTKRDNITRRDKPIKDSPFKIMVVEAPKSKRKPAEEEPATVGNLCHPCLDAPDVDIPDDLPVLSGVLSRPSGKEEPIDVKEGPNKTLSVDFVPEEPGEHLVHIKKRRKPIENSPYKVIVEEPTEQGPEVGKPCEASLPAKGLNLPRDLPELRGTLERPDGTEEPVDVKAGPNDTLSVNFTPKQPGKHLIHIKKGRRPIDGSPFEIMVSPASKKKPEGPEVGSPCEASLPAKGLNLPRDLPELHGILERPDGTEEPVDVKAGPNDTLSVNFTPKQPGKHLLHIKKGRRPIDGSPFEILVSPASKDKPEGPEVGKPCEASLPAKSLNLPKDLPELRGILERPDGTEEPVDVKAGPNDTLSVNFTPKQPGKHLLHIKKGRRPIDESPFEIMVLPASEETPEGPEVGKPCEASLPAKGLNLPKDLPELHGTLERPDGTEEPVDVKAGPNDTLSVNFTPKQPGKHLIHIKKGRRPIDGSPFEIMVSPASKDKPEGPEVGKPCEASLPAKSLNLPKDLPELRGILERPDGTEEPVDVKAGPNDTLSVNFTPKQPGKHLLHIKKGRRPIDESPFEIMVLPASEETPEGPEVGKPCEASLPAKGLNLPKDLPELHGTLERPDGTEEPVDVKAGPNDTLSVNFTPKQPGKHLLHIKKGRRPIDGSPFEIIVSPASKDKPEGPEVGKPCEASLPAKSLNLPKDLPELRGILERPDGTEEPVDVKAGPNDTLLVNFTPKQPGKHLLHIKKGRRPIDESPFEIMVSPVSEEIPEGPEVGKPCEASLPAKGLNLPRDLPELRGILERPDGTEEPVDVKAGPNDTLSVNFTPKQPGKHLIHIKKGRRPIDGSPFEIMVLPASKKEPKAPKVGSPTEVAIPAKELNLPKDLPDVHGTLERPDGTEEPVDVKAGPNDTLTVNFTPRQPGKHLIHIKKGRRPIEGSPFEVIVEPAPQVGKQCDVSVPAEGLKLPSDLPELQGVLARPNGVEEPLDVHGSPDNDSLSVAFTPKEPGKHLVHIRKRGKPINGSPFEVIVEAAAPKVGSPCDVGLPADGLNLPRDLPQLKGILERPNGKEEPLDVQASPENNSLSVSFTPKEPGRHLIHIKKGRAPITGSPFEVIVDAAAPKVGSPCDVGIPADELNLPADLPQLQGVLERPNGKEEPVDVKDGPNKSLSVSFVPKEPGKHKIHIKKGRKPIKGSPFVVDVEEAAPKAPKVGSPTDVGIPAKGLKFPDDLPDLKGVLARPSGKEEPVDVKAGPNDTLSVSFTPEEPGEHLLHIKKRRLPIDGSPFKIIVEEAVPEEKVPTVGNPCDVGLDVAGVKVPEDLPHITGSIERPSGKKEPVDVKAGPNGSLSVTFIPEEPGKHLLHIKKKQIPVRGSPFPIMVEEGAPKGQAPTVGSPCDVNLEIPGIKIPDDLPVLKGVLSRPNGKEEPLDIKAGPEDTLSMNFTPKEPGVHEITITKNGKEVRGSPFKVVVEEAVEPSQLPTVGNECDLNLSIPGVDLPRDLKKLTGTLKRPSSTKEEPLNIKENPDKTIGVSFVPKEPGKHLVSIKKDGKHVASSPFTIVVETAPEPEKGPTVGSPCNVAMELEGVRIPQDLKFLDVTLTRPNKKREEPLEAMAGPDNTLSVNFTPDEPGKYYINIRRNRKHVPSSPIEVVVKAAKPRKPGEPNKIGLEIPGIKLPDDLKLLKASVTTPSGTEEPCELSAGPNNRTIVVSFIPKEAGEHKLNIKKSGRHVGQSPYKVIVKPEDVAPAKPDASKVKAYGKGLKGAPLGEKCDFTVDTREAGYGGLGLSVEGPSKVEINCVDNEDGTCTVDFTPSEPGTYLVNVTYAEEHIPGSPYKCVITDDKPKKGRKPVDDEEIVPMEQDTAESAPDFPDSFSDILAFPSSKGQPPQDFTIKYSGRPGDMTASVTRPSGKEDDAELISAGRDTYTVRFVPRETGEHLVNVKVLRKHIPGSPFKVMVEAPAGGAKACRASGPGLDHAVAGEPCRFTVITRDAGPGGLAVAVEGPAKAEIQCHDNGDGSCDITWYPVEPGEYTVHIRFADEPIPDSPFTVMVAPADAGSAMSMAQFKEQDLKVGQAASFAVQMKGKIGKLTASVIQPSGSQIECTVIELEEGNYAVRFVPKEYGEHLVNVFLDKQHIPGSPFKVKVGGVEGDPGKVRAYGPGLQGGVANKSAEFTVNALNAGSGALALSIDGPAKVKMNCVEQEDGTYLVTYNPTVAGSYEISVRFAGQHIPGSPYKVRIVGEGETPPLLGDANKVTSRGAGLSRAVIGQPNTFTVNASSAGRGSLMVGVEGPAIPAKEIVVKHTGGSIYSVNYTLEERGDYILKVLWGDCHIPGSPFHVTV